MQTAKIVESKCTQCHEKLDAASHPTNTAAKPKPGDLSICLYCSTIHTFDDELKLQRTYLEDLDEDIRPDVQSALLMVAKVREAKNRK